MSRRLDDPRGDEPICFSHNPCRSGCTLLRVYTALSSAMALSVTPLWAAAFGCNVEKRYHLCALDFIAEGAAGPKYAVHRQPNEIACRKQAVCHARGGHDETEGPDESLGGNEHTRHRNGGAAAEVVQRWAKIVDVGVRGTLKNPYAPVDANCQEKKPTREHSPTIPSDTVTLDQLN